MVIFTRGFATCGSFAFGVHLVKATRKKKKLLFVFICENTAFDVHTVKATLENISVKAIRKNTAFGVHLVKAIRKNTALCVHS